MRFIRGEDVNAQRTMMTRSTGEHLVTRDNVHALETTKRYDPVEQAKRDMEAETAAEGEK